MNYRLFISNEALEFLLGLKPSQRRFLRAKLEELRAYPSAHSHYQWRDATGRRIEVCIAGKFAIEFWEDAADMDVKIISILLADTGSL